MAALRAVALTREAFEPFGDVIQVEGATNHVINAGMARRFDDLARVVTDEPDGAAALSIFVSQVAPRPIRIVQMERHPLGSQAFVPLDGSEFAVIVAGDGPDGPGAPCAFVATNGQGVNLRQGVWHHPLTVLRGPGRFLVADRIGPGENLELADYPSPGYEVIL